MKKIYIIFGAFLISIICIVGLDVFIKQKLNDNVTNAIYYNNALTRNCSDYMMEKIITKNSIVVLGSSELYASDNLAYPTALFNQGYSDYNMILMGTGYLQSLAQSINVGSLDNNIKNNKIVLILSPQWFDSKQLSPGAFSSAFTETNFLEFLKNDKISKDTKIKISNRVNELLVADTKSLERVIKYEDIFLNHSFNPIKHLEISTYSKFRNSKLRFELYNELKNREVTIDYNHYVKAEKIDFKKLLIEAEKIGSASCTNNEYGVYDEYFETFIKNQYESLKNSSANSNFTTSKEYNDFRLFLDVCKETGIEPLIVSVPVNGRWYDYTGFSKENRAQYYQNIRSICKEYGVELADFSDKEYEKYFLKDIMHLGWKGWVYVDEAVYKFYKK